MIDPCLPRSWDGYRATYRHHDAIYNISIVKPRGVCRGVLSIELDGTVLDGRAVPLREVGVHSVTVHMG